MSGHSKWANIKRKKQANDLVKGNVFAKRLSHLKEIIYEGFGPYGVFLLILSTTDNSNRTSSEIRNMLEKNSGKLGTPGSVSYLFKKCAFVSFMKTEVNEEAVFKIGEELQAFDINEDNSHFFVFFPFSNFGLLKTHLSNIKYDLAEIDYLPTMPVTLDSPDKEKKVLGIIEALESLDDIQRVYTNLG